MQLWVGTSGFSYKAWKGSFYPDKLPDRAMLDFYGQHFNAVEINNTFYRLPKAEQLRNWAEQVPEDFRFAIKASRRITHQQRLRDCEDTVAYIVESVQVLGARLGLVFFQLPPYLRCDLPRLQAFLGLLPKDMPAAFEFRHESWSNPAVIDTLSQRNMAWVDSDTDQPPLEQLTTGADWAYLRLRGSAYDQASLQRWHQRLLDGPWRQAYVFFKHEDAGTGPRWASQLRSFGP